MNRSLMLLLAIGDVDTRHIEGIEKSIKHHNIRVFIRIGIGAACLVLLLSAFYFNAVRKSTPPPSSDFISTQMPAPETISFQELISRADIIISATVTTEHHTPSSIASEYLTDSWIAEYSPTPNTTPYSISVDIQIERVLKGDISIHETIRIPISAIAEYDHSGTYIQTYAFRGMRLMKSGDQVVLFLREYSANNAKKYLPIGEVGIWFGDSSENYRCGITYNEQYSEQYVPNIGLTAYPTYTIHEIEKKINEK